MPGDATPDPRVDAYIEALPEWQQAICREVRAIVYAADPAVVETIKRRDRPDIVPMAMKRSAPPTRQPEPPAHARRPVVLTPVVAPLPAGQDMLRGSSCGCKCRIALAKPPRGAREFAARSGPPSMRAPLPVNPPANVLSLRRARGPLRCLPGPLARAGAPAGCPARRAMVGIPWETRARS